MVSDRRIEKHPDGSSTIYAGKGVEPVHVSARQPDGTATITAKGLQYTLTPDEVDQLINKWQPRTSKTQEPSSFGEVAVLSLGEMSRVYDTVKDIMQTPHEREKVLESFRFMCNMFKEGKWVGRPDAGEEIVETILRYPKILSEEELPTSMVGVTDEDIRRAFVDCGEIKLPFPRITVIKGGRVDRDPANPSQLVAEVDLPGVNTLMSYFLIQDDDQIKVEFVVGDSSVAMRHPKAKLQVASLLLYVADGDVRIGHLMNSSSANIAKQISGGDMKDILTLIYMMTHSGGNFMMSRPTEIEVLTNTKRLRKGKKPLIEFKLITIDGRKKDTLPSIPQGTHAPPRQHWRRGHYRHYASGKTVFINPMLVGDEKNGKIIKDYAVGAYEDQRHERGSANTHRTH